MAESQCNGSNGINLKKSSSSGLFKDLVPTTCKKGVPVLFHEPHVEKGFRVLGQPWLYYLQSVFQLHNESMNIWTHLLAFILVGQKIFSIGYQVDYWYDQHTWPLLAGLTSGLILYGSSSAAHCLQSKSELAHYTAFMFDYAGIGLYGLGSVMIHLYYSADESFYNTAQTFFVPMGSFLAVAICFCCSISKILYSRPYPFMRKIWQMTPVGAIYFLLISPIVHRIYLCYAHDVSCSDSISIHIQQMAWFAMSGLFFSIDYPQCLAPGRCDNFGHSHQLFHLAIMMCTLRQIDAVMIDFATRKDLIMSRPLPSFCSTFGAVAFAWLAELVCILCFYIYTRDYVLGADKNKKQEVKKEN